MVVARVFNLKNIQTALRHWIPVTLPIKKTAIAQFSSRHQCVDFYRQDVPKLVVSAKEEEEAFEPSVSLTEEIETAGPVNKA